MFRSDAGPDGRIIGILQTPVQRPGRGGGSSSRGCCPSCALVTSAKCLWAIHARSWRPSVSGSLQGVPSFWTIQKSGSGRPWHVSLCGHRSGSGSGSLPSASLWPTLPSGCWQGELLPRSGLSPLTAGNPMPSKGPSVLVCVCRALACPPPAGIREMQEVQLHRASQ